MKKKNSTVRALLLSVLSVVLCLAMLAGSTFAWFTDSVSTGVNRIVAGNLDVELYARTRASGGYSDYARVTDKTNLFTDGALWEPGHVEVVNLKVVNEGALALKYSFGVNIKDETPGVNVYNAPFKLSDYIEFAVIDGEQTYDNRDAAIEAAEAAGHTSISKMTVRESGVLYPHGTADSEKCVTLVVYMPTTVDDNANYLTDETANPPEITLGVSLYATQTPYEADSFGIDYDAAALLPWDGSVASKEALAAATDEESKTLLITTPEMLAAFSEDVNGGNPYVGYIAKLGNDINMNNLAWTPAGNAEHPFQGEFDGSGYSVVGLSAELFGSVQDANISDLHIAVNSTTGGLIANASGESTLENIRVSGSISGTAPEKNAAFILETKTGSNTTIRNCVNDAAVESTNNSAAGFVGSAYGTLTFVGCVNNGSMASNAATGAKAAGYIVTARPGAAISFTDCVNNGDMAVNGGAEMYAAGFIAWNGSSNLTVTMTGCTNNGNISGTRSTDGGSTIALGGIIGTCWNAGCNTTLTNVVNNGTIHAVNNASSHNAHVGGIVGMCNPSANTTIVSATSNGALICEVNNSAGTANVGGLVGQANGTTITVQDATITENVTVTATSSMTNNVDALVGNVAMSTVTVAQYTNNSGIPCRYE